MELHCIVENLIIQQSCLHPDWFKGHPWTGKVKVLWVKLKLGKK